MLPNFSRAQALQWGDLVDVTKWSEHPETPVAFTADLWRSISDAESIRKILLHMPVGYSRANFAVSVNNQIPYRLSLIKDEKGIIIDWNPATWTQAMR